MERKSTLEHILLFYNFNISACRSFGIFSQSTKVFGETLLHQLSGCFTVLLKLFTRSKNITETPYMCIIQLWKGTILGQRLDSEFSELNHSLRQVCLIAFGNMLTHSLFSKTARRSFYQKVQILLLGELFLFSKVDHWIVSFFWEKKLQFPKKQNEM